MENEVKTSKKLKIVLIIGAVLLILVAAFLLWFFNRKFDVTFKINDSEKYTVQVKYNKTINEKDIKDKEELGDNFIDWYEVIKTEDNEDVLAEEAFDFSTKIKEEKSLKAVYKVEEPEEEPEEEPKDEVKKITITFDSKGGSKVSSVSINEGGKLTLPKNPTRSGYTFVSWTLANGNTVKNNSVFNANTTLYATWKKVEETKKEEPKVEEPKEETISLSLSRSTIHRKGYTTSKATAKVENASGAVTYSIDNNVCVSINKTTGDLTANEAATGSGAKVRAWMNACANDGKTVTVTATLPSGKSATATLTIEKDLVLYASNSSLKREEEINAKAGNGKVLPADSSKRFYVDANQVVTWTAKANDTYETCTPVNVTSTSDSYVGDLNAQCTDGNARNTYITATTPANQSLTIQYYQNIN